MVVRNWATRALTCNKEEVTTAVSVVKGTAALISRRRR